MAPLRSAIAAASILAVAAPLAVAVMAGCGGTTGQENARAGVSPPGSYAGPVTPQGKGPFRFFSQTSVWNTPLADDAPLDPDSAELMAAFDAEVQREIRNRKGPAINTTAFSVPIYTVPAGQPTVKVTLRQSSTSSALRAAWREVPLPASARPAVGTDRHLVVWQPSTGKLWEFWLLERRADGWHAGWGGAMQNAYSSSGVFGPNTWPGSTQWWGASASSLSIAGGLIMLEDLKRERIDHALAIALPHVRAGVYSSPAQRTDGQSKDPLTLPEGAHLRLDPKLNVDALQLPPLTRMIAEAAQRYGILVRDGASSVALYAQDPSPTGGNPFLGPDGYFEGARAPLDSFPWSRMQLLRMNLHRNQ